MKLFVVTTVSLFTRETKHGSGVYETTPVRDHKSFWAKQDGTPPMNMVAA